MKVALIIPSWHAEEIFSSRTSPSQINYWQPVGTLSVAASLREHGHEVSFQNGAFLSHHELIKKTEDFVPAVVGLYATAFSWDKAVATAAVLRRRFPDTFFVVGGPYPISMPEACLADAPAIDAVVTGEGEETMVELLDLLRKRAPLDQCRGLCFRHGGAIVRTPDRPLIRDLDSLPFPARDLIGEPDHYLPPPAAFRRSPVAVVLTSRGCDRKCIYCFQLDKSRKSGVRYRSVASVLEEVEDCLAMGYREIKFIDDTLAADYQRAMELAAGIRARNLDFTWFASACVNQVDYPLLRAFKKAGCWAILMGVESGVQKNLNTLRKGITLAQAEKAVAAAKRAGLVVFNTFVFGIPGETVAQAEKTIDFACRLNPDFASFHALTPFPGTLLHDMAKDHGTLADDLRDYTYQGAAFVPHTMTGKDIHSLRQRAYRRFYSRPGYLLRRAVGIRTLHELKTAGQSLKTLCWLWIKPEIFSKRQRLFQARTMPKLVEKV